MFAPENERHGHPGAFRAYKIIINVASGLEDRLEPLQRLKRFNVCSRL